MKEIAEKLKAFRLADRMTLKQLASKAGCTDGLSLSTRKRPCESLHHDPEKDCLRLQVKVVDFFLEPETQENRCGLQGRGEGKYTI